MRLKNFLTPSKNITSDEAKNYIETHNQGSFTLLDVRQPKEYEKDHIPGSKLIPLPQLLERIDELDPQKPVLTY